MNNSKNITEKPPEINNRSKETRRHREKSTALLLHLESGQRINHEDVEFFVAEIYKAVQHGLILSNDRPLRIYRVVKEINDEMRRLNGVWDGWDKRRASKSAVEGGKVQ